MAQEVIFSEYLEGINNDKSIELYSGCSVAIDLSQYTIEIYFDGASVPGATIHFPYYVFYPGDAVLISNPGASQPILDVSDFLDPAINFDGNDAIVLRKNSEVKDVIGQVGYNPGNQWGMDPTSTEDNIIRRKPGIVNGDHIESDLFDPELEWIGFGLDRLEDLSEHSILSPYFNLAVCYIGEPGVYASEAKFGYLARDLTDEEVFTNSVSNGGIIPEGIPVGENTERIWSTNNYTLNANPYVWSVKIGSSQKTATISSVYIEGIGGVNSLVTEQNQCPVTDTQIENSLKRIHDIKQPGNPLNDSIIIIQGIVTGDFQGNDQLEGFFVQEEDVDMDADPLTSEGIFIYDPSILVDVNIGDSVRLTGKVRSLNGQIQLYMVEEITVLSVNRPLPSYQNLNLPMQNLSDPEHLEGMRVQTVNNLTLVNTDSLRKYGELTFSSIGRLYSPTQVALPGQSAQDTLAKNILSQLILDDGSLTEFPDPIPYPSSGMDASSTLRLGTQVSQLSGILNLAESGYRLIPDHEPVFSNNDNPRTPVPDVGGDLTIVSFNLGKFFDGDGFGGGFPTSGADTYNEFTRQRDKILSAIIAMDPDILGITEIENDGFGLNSAVDLLVRELNSQSGSIYQYIDPLTGILGNGETTCGIIYKSTSVQLSGNTSFLDSSVDPLFNDQFNAPSLAQSFTDICSGDEFTIVVNQFASKLADCSIIGDLNTGDGQGNCNLTRVNAAKTMINWITGNPTGCSTNNILVLGDMNAFVMEDPQMEVFRSSFINLAQDFLGINHYTGNSNSESGSLNNIHANGRGFELITGVDIWHINSDEPEALDYNTENKTLSQLSDLYQSDPYRSSATDPLLIGLSFKNFNCPVDLNKDLNIDGIDYALIVGQMGSFCDCCPEDIDTDGSIGGIDYALLVGQFGSTCTGQQTITDIEGNTYPLVQIGNQVWIAQNLRTSTLNDGTKLQEALSDPEWISLNGPGFCRYNNDSVNYFSRTGNLYNGYAVSTGKLCPSGWRVPTESDWKELENLLGGSMVAGGKLKEKSFLNWNFPNSGATDEYGFKALPGGLREQSGAFYGECKSGYWWTSTNISDSLVYFNLENTSESTTTGNDKENEAGLSVRCIKNE